MRIHARSEIYCQIEVRTKSALRDRIRSQSVHQQYYATPSFVSSISMRGWDTGSIHN